MKIKYLNHGIASRIGNTLYVNIELKKWPKLCKALIKHEKAHSSGFCWEDIRIDFKGKYIRGFKKEYYFFILKNPRALTQFFPGWFYDGKFVLDPLMLIAWSLITIMIGVIGLNIK